MFDTLTVAEPPKYFSYELRWSADGLYWITTFLSRPGLVPGYSWCSFSTDSLSRYTATIGPVRCICASGAGVGAGVGVPSFFSALVSLQVARNRRQRRWYREYAGVPTLDYSAASAAVPSKRASLYADFVREFCSNNYGWLLAYLCSHLKGTRNSNVGLKTTYSIEGRAM